MCSWFSCKLIIIVFLEHIKAGPEGGANAGLEDVDEEKVEKHQTQEQEVRLAQAKTWKNLGLYFIKFFCSQTCVEPVVGQLGRRCCPISSDDVGHVEVTFNR